MSGKTMNILKAAFFALLLVMLLIFKGAGVIDEGAKWFWIAVGLCVILAVAYLKQAFDK